MKISLFGLLSVIILATPVCAQQSASTPQSSQPQPKTKLETFAAQTGSVIVEGFSTVGTIRGEYGSVSVDAKEFTNATSGKHERGVTIEVKEAGRMEREGRSFIDYDEIDPLI